MSKKSEIRDAKRKAYAEKKEKEGAKVINWIFAILVLMGIALCAYTCLNA